mmetsp:Transcript_16812/g.21278  ORF Transcript_16812/g.21278 Transcript_16812/m.21278 type:complete len:331 (-) Transcript_16812:150-1142(-)
MEESGVVHLAVVDSLHLRLIEPFNALAVLPQAILHLVVFGHDVGAEPVLLALVPVALVAALIGPGIDAETMLFVVFVLALVHSTIVPDVNAHALHVVVQPLALILATIEPGVDANTTDFVLAPVARVHGAIVPLVAADTVLAAESIVALIARLVRPGLHTVPVLQVVLPHALILRTVDVLVDTTTIGFIVGPVPVINVSIDMNKSALAMCTVFSPLSRVFGPVAPGLFAETITESALPLASVHRACLESVGWALLTCLIGIVDALCHGLARLLLCEVFATAELFCLEQGDQSTSSVPTPSCLQLHDKSHFCHKQLRVVALSRLGSSVAAS